MMVPEHDIGLSQREMLLEMRADLKALATVVDTIAREQAVNTERRSQMFDRARTIDARLDNHEKAVADLQRWRDEAAGALRLARWALGASLFASILMGIQIVSFIAEAVRP